MSKTKIFEYIHCLEDGGAETLVKDYALLIDKEKFDICIIITREYRASANLERVKAAGIPIHTIYPCWNVFMKLWHETMGRWWYVPYKLRKIIRQEQPQAMHIHLAMLKYVQKIGSALDGIRLFYTCHSTPQATFSRKQRAEIKAAQKLIRKNKLQLIALHKDMANELNARFKVDNTLVIRNGIDFKRFRNLNITKEQERIVLGISKDAFVLGHVGRFNPVKNHPFLVEVFNEVAKRNDKAFLLMVGAGDTAPIEAKLREYGLSDRYMILSHRTDVNEIMRVMDVFVFPSLYEGLGIVMIEAQVSGLRCVASDQVPEEAFKTEDAISLPLGDTGKWADVILDTSIKGNHSGSLDDYDMNKEIRRLEKLYSGEWNP